MSEIEPPLLVDVHPALVSFLDAALIAEGEPALARSLAGLRLHGWSRCSPACVHLRTAPEGRADSTWIHFDGDVAPGVWLQLDRDRESFAGMEICGFDLGADPGRPSGRPTGRPTGRDPGRPTGSGDGGT
ncbi:hypothetical protein ACGFYF_27955 [Streptomyces lavendulae]|uniref:hypothetical protein n=1 Tax=Streptomyces lavendulae TaxID=1914 RepID=UPI00371C65D1